MKDNIVAEWFYFGDNDLRAAKILEQSHPQPLEIICYHCQQSAEKYLKGYLISKGVISPPKIHDLGVLCEMCAKFDENFFDIETACKILTAYAAQARYPDEMYIDEGLMGQSLSYAEEIKLFPPFMAVRQTSEGENKDVD
jgi:HEPN domain-containing protein